MVAKLTNIRGMNDRNMQRLHAEGIRSVEALLKAGKTSVGWRALEQTQISRPLILQWVNHADLRIANPTICPFGFWSLQKIIERRDVAGQGPEAAGGQSFPLPNRRHLPPIDSVLFASSDKVVAEDRDRAWQSLEALLSCAKLALSWTQWRQLLASRVPSILLALPHHDVEDGLDYLKIGDKGLPQVEGGCSAASSSRSS